MSENRLSLPTAAVDRSTLEALLQASAVINQSLDLQNVLQGIAQAAADVLGAEASSVILLDPVRKKLVFKAAVGANSDALLGQEFDARLGIAGRVADSGQPEIVPDARAHPDFLPEFDKKGTFSTRGMIAAPLRYRDETLGVVEVINKRGEARFGPADLEILKLFANLAAITTSNAQLHDRLKRENIGLKRSVQSDESITGQSKALREVLALCDRVAATNVTVLLLGETGTGKELTARRVHAASLRSQKPFIAINCAALAETLLESELFGHESGAFTGATSTKLGRFELADGGTLFLDEIGDISASTQVKLLRVLQEREFTRVGGIKTLSCDVRIIAATNKDLKVAIDQGDFREDLYYRLNVFPIHLPPLRERREDIPLLVALFAQRCARELGVPKRTLAPQTMELLCAYDWPGNIREMRNVIERAVLLADSGTITPELLPREMAAASALPAGPMAGSALENYEKAMIVKTLEEHDWNQTRAAEALGISRDNLRYRVKKYGIQRAS